MFLDAARNWIGGEGIIVAKTAIPAKCFLALAGQGMLRTTEWVVRDELKKGLLVPVMPRWSCDHPQHGGVPVFVMYAQAATAVPPLKSRVFVELVKGIVAAEIG